MIRNKTCTYIKLVQKAISLYLLASLSSPLNCVKFRKYSLATVSLGGSGHRQFFRMFTERCGRNPHSHAFSPSPKTEYPGEVWGGRCENKTKLEAQFIQNLSVDNRRIHVLFNGWGRGKFTIQLIKLKFQGFWIALSSYKTLYLILCSLLCILF